MIKRAIVKAAFFVVATASGMHPCWADPAANKLVVEKAFAAFQAGDVNTINALFAPDAPSHGPDGKDSTQGGPFTKLADACPMCARLTDRNIRIDLILAENDLVSVRSIWQGTYVGTARDVVISGKPVTTTYFNIYRIRDGRIVENWFCQDRLVIATELGFTLTPPKDSVMKSSPTTDAK